MVESIDPGQFVAAPLGVAFFRPVESGKKPTSEIGMAVARDRDTGGWRRARHGCRVWAAGKPGAGATFYSAMPTTESRHAK